MKKISPVRAFLLAGLLFLPAFALAQGGAPELVKGFGTVGDVVNSFTKNVVTALSTLFATMAMAAFFFGLVQYIWGVRDGKPEKVKAGNQFMIYGLLALFVMFSVWGIITYAQKIFGVTGSTITIPTIEFGKGNTAPSSTGLDTSPTTYYCPDGSPYYNQSDRKFCPPAPSSNGTNPGTTQMVYYCSDGTKYYDQSDFKTVCARSTSGGALNCSTIHDGSTCEQMGCSWNNSELSCSQ